MESHDEERIMYKNEQYANQGNAAYNTRSVTIGTKRNGMAAAFFAMIPGPKMVWQFGELGYDYSRCYLSTNGEGGDCNTKLDPKPVKWDYQQNVDRQALYSVYSNLFKLRNNASYLSTFTTGTITRDLSSAVKWLIVQDNALKVVVIGNFDIYAKTATISFPNVGLWYSYLTGTSISLSSTAYTVTLQPGEYYVYTNKEVILPVNLLSFTASKNSQHTVEVTWSTTSEINNHHYEVERSNNGTSFTALASVQPSASVAQIKQYRYTDAAPLTGVNYYRLKQVDKDGKVHYSSIAKVNFTAQNILWQVYPNPAHTVTSVYAQSNMSKVQVILTDLSGKTLYRSNLIPELNEGQKINVPVKNLSKGIYILKVVSNETNTTQKLVVE